MKTGQKFSWIEYITLGALLSIPAFVGIYYGFIKANQNTVSEYIHGGKNMKIFPITLSLLAYHITPVSIVGFSSETYEFGLQIIMEVVGVLVVFYVVNEFYLPVFYNLDLNSTFKHLELRFSNTVARISSIIFLIQVVLYLPMIIYVSGLAFQQCFSIIFFHRVIFCLFLITGSSFYLIILIFIASCVFYTSIGGLKTVVWTSVIYTIFNCSILLIMFVLGVFKNGGLGVIYDSNAKSGRWEMFNFNPSPYMRVTVWSATLGSLCKWINFVAINPGSLQRFMSLPSERGAKWALLWDTLGIAAMTISCSLQGLVMYAYFDGCDPLIAKREVQKSAQLLPHFVQKISTSFPGLTGFFVSGLIGAALSAMSAALNTIAGTLYEDFIRSYMPEDKKEETASFIMKIIVVVMGFVCVGGVFIIEKLGTVMDMIYSVLACQQAPLLTVYTLGMFLPHSNTMGAICGIVSSIMFTGWIVIGRQLAIVCQHLVYRGKISRTDTCPKEWNITTSQYSDLTALNSNVLIHPKEMFIYAVSFLYLILMGAVLGICVGFSVSLLTGSNDLKQLDPDLIIPPLRKYLKSPEKATKESGTNTNAVIST